MKGQVLNKYFAASAVSWVLLTGGMLLGSDRASAEPDISCATGNSTGKDTSSPTFTRTYPQACVAKFLGLVHADGFSAPGGDVELVTLGKTACDALDVDQENGDVSGAKAIDAAEPKLTYASANGSLEFHDPGRQLVSLAIKGLCP